MAIHTVEEAQRKAARLAGITYMLTMATANFADFYVRPRLFLPADPAQTARNIAASGALFRAGIVSDLVTIAGSVILLVALYVILRPINQDCGIGRGLLVAFGVRRCSNRYFEQSGRFVSPERDGFIASV